MYFFLVLHLPNHPWGKKNDRSLAKGNNEPTKNIDCWKVNNKTKNKTQDTLMKLKKDHQLMTKFILGTGNFNIGNV